MESQLDVAKPSTSDLVILRQKLSELARQLQQEQPDVYRMFENASGQVFVACVLTKEEYLRLRVGTEDENDHYSMLCTETKAKDTSDHYSMFYNSLKKEWDDEARALNCLNNLCEKLSVERPAGRWTLEDVKYISCISNKPLL